MSTIGERIKIIRTKNDLKQEEFAESLSVSRSFISRIESNKEKASDTLLKLISLQYNVSYRWIQCGEGSYNIDRDTDYFGRGYEQEFKSSILPSFYELLNELDRMNSAALYLSVAAIIDESTNLLKIYNKSKNVGIVVFDKLTGIFIEYLTTLNKCEQEKGMIEIKQKFNTLSQTTSELTNELKAEFLNRTSKKD